LIENWIREFIDEKKRKGINTVLEYYDYCEELKIYLTDHVEKKVGLNIQFDLPLKNEDELREYKIESENFPVHVKDHDDELNLSFKIGLDINEKYKIYAILNYIRLEELKKLFQEKIKKYMHEQVSLHHFVYDLNNDVKKVLTGVLNKVLEEKGREITWFKLESKINSTPRESQKFNHTVKCDIKDYSDKIEIQHKLLMQLENLGKSKSNDIGDLEIWVKEKLSDITQSILFEKNYVDILLDFEKAEEKQAILNEIKTKMQKLALSIGYTVKHLIVEPNLVPLKFKKDGFIVEEKEATFATRDTRVNVKLEIVATGRIKDLRKISKYITPDKDLIEEMRHVINNEILKEMHLVNPEHFYMPFNFPSQKPAEEMLEESIKEKIKSEFFAEDVNVVIKIVETGLIDQIKKLITGGPYSFNIDILPLKHAGHRETVTFKIEFSIQGVDKNGWQLFLFRISKSTDEVIDKIKKTLGDAITVNFQTIPADVLLSGDIKVWKDLLKVAQISQADIADEFGLNILIRRIGRQATIIETANQKVLQMKVEAQTEKEFEMTKINDEVDIETLKNLQDKKSELLDPDLADDEKIAQLDKQISELIKKSAYPVDKGKMLLKPAKNDSSEGWDFDIYFDVTKNEATPSGRESLKAIKGEEKGDE
jgi:hypothetical protein